MKFTEKPILVIGDLILDEFLYGTASRLSPEAPVPVVGVGNSEYRLGGAANVAANIRDLGGAPIVIGIAGFDIEGHALVGLLNNEDCSMRLVRTERRTTSKTRIVCNGQQIARLDREDTSELSSGVKQQICNIVAATPAPAAIVVSDYAKGVVSEEVLAAVDDLAMKYGVPIFLDPKVGSADYRNVKALTCITPNEQEAKGLTGKASLMEAGGCLVDPDPDGFWSIYALITLGKDGMKLFNFNYPVVDFPITAKTVFDVSGAGDTVIATLALAYASGIHMKDAAHLANLAAGIVVSKQGTATVTIDELTLAEEEWQTRTHRQQQTA